LRQRNFSSKQVNGPDDSEQLRVAIVVSLSAETIVRVGHTDSWIGSSDATHRCSDNRIHSRADDRHIAFGPDAGRRTPIWQARRQSRSEAPGATAQNSTCGQAKCSRLPAPLPVIVPPLGYERASDASLSSISRHELLSTLAHSRDFRVTPRRAGISCVL